MHSNKLSRPTKECYRVLTYEAEIIYPIIHKVLNITWTWHVFFYILYILYNFPHTNNTVQLIALYST